MKIALELVEKAELNWEEKDLLEAEAKLLC